MSEDQLFLETVKRMVAHGQVSTPDLLKAMADAKDARRLRLYVLISTIAAAVSAIASAVAAFLTYLNLHH
jgi:hypothetical protein